MILYTNGSAHTAAAEAVNSYAFADDDLKYQHLGHVPHPNNMQVAYGTVLANLLKMTYHNAANTSKSNADIISSTKEWIEERADIVSADDVFMIIQWATFNDVEMVHEHENIIAFHLYLKKLGYKHIFFNGVKSFFNVLGADHYDFGEYYLEPYLPEGSFDGWLQLNGYQPVITSNTQFGAEAHAGWTRHLIQHINKNKMV